jgi:hypothetical protein
VNKVIFFPLLCPSIHFFIGHYPKRRLRPKMSHSTSKRSRGDDEEKCEEDAHEGVMVRFSRNFAREMGKGFCLMDELTKDDLLNALISTKDIKIIRGCDLIDVVVSGLVGDKCMTLKLPLGEGFSSIWSVKENVNTLWGIPEKMQLLLDDDGDENEPLDDNFLLRRKPCGSMSWKLTLVLCESRGAYSYDDVTTSSMLCELLDDGTTLRVLSSKAFYEQPIDILPKLFPATGLVYEHDGVYTISFELKYSDSITGSSIPALTSGCFIGLKNLRITENTNCSKSWGIDIHTGKIFNDFDEDDSDWVGFLHPGHVLTMRLNCRRSMLYFYRDAKIHGSISVDKGAMHHGLQFFVNVFVAGFDICIVCDPDPLPSHESRTD